MQRKLKFYERYGVEEYYVLDPDFARHKGYLRQDDKLVPIPDLFGWTSPRLSIRFEMNQTEKKVLRIIGSDGRLFEPYTVLAQKLDKSERLVADERLRADEERLRADEQRLRPSGCWLNFALWDWSRRRDRPAFRWSTPLSAGRLA